MNITNQKNWYESKLLWYAILSGVAGVISVLAQMYPDVGYIAIANSLVVGALRLVTNAPIK